MNSNIKHFIADLHIHSHYSLATSKNLTPEHLDYWAALKGISVVGTGDCLHPGWLSELKTKLHREKNGLYSLKKEYILAERSKIPVYENIYFVPTTEISCIYKKLGSVKKVHILIVFPDFESVEKYQSRLLKIGNLSSDGRPILGIDSKELLAILLQTCDSALFIPAHIWTPWFSVLGSKSGFDTIEDCFEDLTQNIYAVETGLSSDPPMNWLCTFLDKFTLISNSDAHSPEKLGREGNLFKGSITYENIYNSLKNRDSGNFMGTIEFFPQEGKYHLDGHRKCGICYDPLQTLKNRGICPQCGKPLTRGVLYRVAELSDRNDISGFNFKKDFYSITPLAQTISEFLGVSPVSKKVKEEYFKLVDLFGPEFSILLYSDIKDISDKYNDLFAEGLRRIRKKEVIISPGYDGEFGSVRVFTQEEITAKSIKSYSFDFSGEVRNIKKAKSENISSNPLLEFNIDEFLKLKKTDENTLVPQNLKSQKRLESYSLKNSGQAEAINHFSGPCLTIAGPGSGKTYALTERINFLITEKKIPANEILTITFTNKACNEIRNRLNKRGSIFEEVFVSTFHRTGLLIISENLKTIERNDGFLIIDECQKADILTELFKLSKKEISKLSKEISAYKQRIGSEIDEELETIIEIYDGELKKRNLFDIDDLVYIPMILLENNSKILNQYRKKFKWILIDEYQDINKIQFNLLKILLSEDEKNIFAIGDPDQSIYGFRGSDQSYILNFKNDFPDAKIIELDKSYRCTDKILSAAIQVLDKERKIEGTEEGLKITIKKCDTSYSEAEWIASEIEKMIGGVRHFSIDSGVSDGAETAGISGFGNFAVLCRTAEQFLQIKKAFAHHSIPYTAYGEKPFYELEPFSKILMDFKTRYSTDENGILLGLKNIHSKEKNSVLESIQAFFEKTDAIKTPEDNENFIRLKLQAENAGHNFNEFFNSLTLNAPIDFLSTEPESVSLLTLHSSKGLEFDVVFIAGCEDKIIPFEIFEKKSLKEIDEERRLFYVGMTRAKKFLFISYALKRYWKNRAFTLEKSRFLDKIEKSLYNNLKAAVRKNKAVETIPLPF